MASSDEITALAPFRTRSFRFQWPADLCTAWAHEMESLILGWYVLVETGSVMMLTIYGALLLVGTTVSPLIGAYGDRLGLRRVLTAMRASYTVFAAMILLLSWAGWLSPTLVLVIAACAGMVRPTDIGMRNALASATVPKVHLVAAIGISRTNQDTARIAGALIGTGFMATFGMTAAYLVITAIYLCSVLLTVRADEGRAVRPGPATPSARPSPWSDIVEGLAYVWRSPRLLAAMCVATLVNLCAFPLSGGLMPYVARDVFQLDQQGLGWLVASWGFGALLGSLTLSAFGARLDPGRAMIGSSFAWIACLIAFIWSPLYLALALFVAAGFFQSLAMLTLAILLLRSSEPQFHGRIMGVRMMAIYTLPLGLLVAGVLIPRFGFHVTVMGMLLLGVLLTLAVWLTWHRALSPVAQHRA